MTRSKYKWLICVCCDGHVEITKGLELGIGATNTSIKEKNRGRSFEMVLADKQRTENNPHTKVVSVASSRTGERKRRIKTLNIAGRKDNDSFLRYIKNGAVKELRQSDVSVPVL